MTSAKPVALKAPPETARIQELDSLRGLLSMSIVLFHLFTQPLFWLWSSVDGFFVLSGFVITRLLLCNPVDGRTLMHFYARRTLRIWPVYYLTLLTAIFLHVIYALKNDEPVSSIRGIPQSMIFLQHIQFYWTPISEYLNYNYIRWFGHSWSLAVEEQFYWLWPLVLLITRKRHSALVAACLLLVGLGLWCRSAGLLVFLLGTRADGLALGALMGVGEKWLLENPGQLQQWRNRLSIAAPAILLACMIGLLPTYLLENFRAVNVENLYFQNSTWPVFLFSVAFAALIAWLWLMQGSQRLRILRNPALLWLGGRSYAIYMFHPPIQAMAERVVEHLHLPHLTVAVLTMGLTLASAHLSFTLVESRLAVYRHRFPMNAAPSHDS